MTDLQFDFLNIIKFNIIISKQYTPIFQQCCHLILKIIGMINTCRPHITYHNIIYNKRKQNNLLTFE